MLARAALLLTNIDYGGKIRFLCKRHIVTFLDFLSFFGKKGGGGGDVFLLPKSQLVTIPNAVKLMCSKPLFQFISTPPPHFELLCAVNLSVLEQLFKSRCLGYRFLAIIDGS